VVWLSHREERIVKDCFSPDGVLCCY